MKFMHQTDVSTLSNISLIMIKGSKDISQTDERKHFARIIAPLTKKKKITTDMVLNVKCEFGVVLLVFSFFYLTFLREGLLLLLV